MKPVKHEDRVTYGLEWYATPEQADARSTDVVNRPGTAHLLHDVGRAPEYDGHDHGTGALLYAVVVP